MTKINSKFVRKSGNRSLYWSVLYQGAVIRYIEYLLYNIYHALILIVPDHPENCHLNVKKMPKTRHFFKKIVKFFNKIANGNFWKKWQFSGGSDLYNIHVHVYNMYLCLYKYEKYWSICTLFSQQFQNRLGYPLVQSCFLVKLRF